MSPYSQDDETLACHPCRSILWRLADITDFPDAPLDDEQDIACLKAHLPDLLQALGRRSDFLRRRPDDACLVDIGHPYFPNIHVEFARPRFGTWDRLRANEIDQLFEGHAR